MTPRGDARSQLLGREYYQTAVGEKYLLLGPIAIHSCAGITKRLLSPSKSFASPRPLSSLLTLTGYTTFLFFLPTHFATHRLLPTSLDAPISSLGPAELDYEFVKLGLQRWPWTSWFLYVGLVGSVALHMVDGWNGIKNMWFRNRTRSKTGVFAGRKQMRALALGGLVLPVLTGLYVISSEPPMVFSSIAWRFETVFLESGMYFA